MTLPILLFSYLILSDIFIYLYLNNLNYNILLIFQINSYSNIIEDPILFLIIISFIFFSLSLFDFFQLFATTNAKQALFGEQDSDTLKILNLQRSVGSFENKHCFKRSITKNSLKQFPPCTRQTLLFII